MPLRVRRLGDGFWFWQAQNPATPVNGWPNGAGEIVGSVFVEVADGIVLVDPQVPPDGPDADRFWAAFDRDLARHPGGWIAIILTFPGHDRSTMEFIARYQAAHRIQTWAPRGSVSWADIAITHPYGDGDRLPGGLIGVTFDLPGGFADAEGAIIVPTHRAVVFGDTVIGREATHPPLPLLRIPPESTFIGPEEESCAQTRAWFATTLCATLGRIRHEYDPDIVLVTHGEPVVEHGAVALATLHAGLSSRTPT